MTSALPPNSDTGSSEGDPSHVGLVPQGSDPSSPLPVHLTAREVATSLRTSPYAVALLCKSGELRATKPGRSWLIEPAAVREYLARTSNQQAAS